MANGAYRSRSDEWECNGVDFIKSSKCYSSYALVDKCKKELKELTNKETLSEEDAKEVDFLQDAIKNEISFIERCEQMETKKYAVTFRHYFFSLLTEAYQAINTKDDFLEVKM